MQSGSSSAPLKRGLVGSSPTTIANLFRWVSGETPRLSSARERFDPATEHHPPLTELAYVLRLDRRFSGFKSQVADQFVCEAEVAEAAGRDPAVRWCEPTRIPQHHAVAEQL